MTPAARVAAAIEILDRYLSGETATPADRIEHMVADGCTVF
ncbi:MAG: hypothetical protein AAFW64_10640 [Pseudomonadota bacterium]